MRRKHREFFIALISKAKNQTINSFYNKAKGIVGPLGFVDLFADSISTTKAVQRRSPELKYSLSILYHFYLCLAYMMHFTKKNRP